MKETTNSATKNQTTKLLDFTTLPSLSLDKLLSEKMPEQAWLVDGRIPASALTIISGQPSSYKTRFTLDVALSIAAGKPLYGIIPTQQSGVMIVDEESGSWLLHRQLLEQGASQGLPIRVRSLHGYMLDEEKTNILLLDCKAYGLNTVIFDSLSHIHDGNENDASDMTPRLKHLQKLTSNGITVLLIHHNRKEGQFPGRGGGEVRGSSAIFAIADAQISLTPKGEDRLVVSQNKLRYAKKPDTFELRIAGDEESFAFEYLGADPAKKARIGRLADAIKKQLKTHGRLNQTELIEKLRTDGIKANDKNMPEALDFLKDRGDIIPVPGPGNNTYYKLALAQSNP